MQRLYPANAFDALLNCLISHLTATRFHNRCAQHSLTHSAYVAILNENTRVFAVSKGV
jgi:hypothetical protein